MMSDLFGNAWCRCIVAIFVLGLQPRHSVAFQAGPGDGSLPRVFSDSTDVLHALYRHRALNQSKKYQPIQDLEAWKANRAGLKEQIVRHTGVKYFKDLPFEVKETRTLKGAGFSVKNIFFQTQPDVYATANLYVPDGSGLFPAVLVMMGHSTNGKLYEYYQLVGQSLAKDGYVALCIDPWGAGERSTVHGEFEYHGTSLGASLLNIGETLMGMQLTDNIRAIDLLSSLSYVDKDKIGATGASGGGNQTMWLAAIDERVKAAMPVVSVGTFDSYIMAHNCVCEVLPNGLNFTEEWGVLGLVAPRAIKMCNHNQESNPTFFPSEMKKSLHKAGSVFKMNGVADHITYELFDRAHGYFPEDREALLGWMDWHLKGKGDGKPRKEKPVELFPEEDLMVFGSGQRAPLVFSTESYCKATGEKLRTGHREISQYDVKKKRAELKSLLALSSGSAEAEALPLGSRNGWERIVLETAEGKIIPMLLKPGTGKRVTVLAHPEGKEALPEADIQAAEWSGQSVAIIDFSGTGEAKSWKSTGFDQLGRMHTYGRASLWLGETVMGNWVKELSQVVDWLSGRFKTDSVSFRGHKEAGLTGIFYAARGGKLNEVHACGSPISYLFDSRKGVEHFGIGIHLPGVLQWGDISLASALAETNLFFHEPVTMSGNLLTSRQKTEVAKEFDLVRKKTGVKGKTVFQ